MDAARPNLPRALLSGSAPISISSIATTAVIAAPAAGLRLRIWKILYVVGGANTVQLLSAATPLTGVMTHATSGAGVAMDEVSAVNAPLFVCGAAEAFNLITTTTALVGGYVVYDVAPAVGS